MADYKLIGAEKRRLRESKIPHQWLLPNTDYQHGPDLVQIPATCGILNEIEVDITSQHDATDILEKLRNGTWTAEIVTTAFCKRAAIAHQLTNCLTEIFFDEAVTRARDLDRKRQEDAEAPRGPFWGLPISLKDNFNISGYDTSTGLACFVNQPAQEHSAMAALLLDLGAVLYCKTNLPQMVMTGDSDNNVFGRTLNPFNKDLTAGGSTGGEGALLAMRGSLIGVGTDIAGSLRIPAICNGIFGYRPSVGVVPHEGVRDLMPPGTGMGGVLSTAGPMATSVRDIALFLETIMKAETWKYDSAVLSLSWTDTQPKSNVRIGLVLDESMFTPTPPVRRGLHKAAELLRSSGNVEVVPLTFPNTTEVYMDLVSYLGLPGTETCLELLSKTGEPVIPSLESTGLFAIPKGDLSKFYELNVRRQAASQEYLKLFRNNNIDAILMPAAAHTALPLDKWTYASYTGIWNYLDYPALVIPIKGEKVSDVDVADDVSNAKYGPGDAAMYQLYTGPEQYKDAPLTVQLVGYRHQDEALIKTAMLVDSIINA